MSEKRFSYGKTPPDAMKKAVEMVKNGFSLRKAAESNGVAHQTLARYVKKFNDSSQARMSPNYAVNAIFTAEEEESLASYVKKCSQMFYGLSTDDVKRLAFQTAITNFKTIPKYWNEHKKATDGWLKRFRKRNPSLSLRTPEGCSLSRATSFNRHNVGLFYNNLFEVLSRSPNRFSSGTRVYNLDETGLTTVQVSAKILAEKGTRQVSKVTSAERGALVTLCCIISATGQFIPPVMIFPRVHFKSHMLNGAPPATLGLANPSGWMNSECFVKVMEHFVNFSLSSKENPTLLIMDNHESHINLNALNYAKDNGVVILTLPPHSSSKMQPLDVTVYKPFKTAYNNAIDNFMMKNPGKTFTIYDIAAAAGYAFEKSMTPSNIVSGFRKTGIFPPDREVFTDVDFMCSDVTDRPLTQSNEIEDDRQNVPVSDELAEKNSAPATTFISPEQFKGYPKASPRLNTRKQRKKGRSLILTDTPEKEELQNKMLNQRKKRKVLQQDSESDNDGKKQINKKRPKKSGKQTANKQKDLQLESETDDADGDEMILQDSSYDGSFTGNFANEDPVPQDIKNGTYVLVRFNVKRKNVYFIGQILKDKDENNEFEVLYLRRNGISNKFTEPAVEDVASLSLKDIERVLPTPALCGHTSRQKASLVFEVDFQSYGSYLK